MPKSARSRMLAALGLCILLWAAAVLTDCARCRALREPLFVVPGVTADDGGSGTYRGLGYAFAITGRFLPEEQDPGVTAYEAWIFHIPVLPGART